MNGADIVTIRAYVTRLRGLIGTLTGIAAVPRRGCPTDLRDEIAGLERELAAFVNEYQRRVLRSHGDATHQPRHAPNRYVVVAGEEP